MWEKLTVRIIHPSNVNVQTAWKVQNETAAELLSDHC